METKYTYVYASAINTSDLPEPLAAGVPQIIYSLASYVHLHWSMAFSTRHRLHVLLLVLAVVALALHSGQSGAHAVRVPAALQEDETTTTTAAPLGVEHAAGDGHGVPSTEIFNVGDAAPSPSPSPSPGDGGHAIFGDGAERASLRGGGGHGGGGHSSGGHSSGGGDGRAAGGGGYVGGAGAGVPHRRSGSGSTKPAIIPAFVSLLGGIATVV